MLEEFFVAMAEKIELPVFQPKVGEAGMERKYETLEQKELSEVPNDINDYNPENIGVSDVGQIKEDNIELQNEVEKFDDPDFINEVRSKNENMDKVMSKAEEVLSNNPSEIDQQKTLNTLERYKGTVFENELKEALDDKFQSVEDKQRVVETEFGTTKPDIVLNEAKEDMKIGNLEIEKGQDLYIEAKAGSSEYIQNQFSHILKQVEGHEGNSLVVVTNDYEKIPVEARLRFEQELKAKDSHIYIADISANQLDLGIIDSLRI